MITFSFNPSKWSTFPRIAASVKIRVVSWNEAAAKNDSLSREALVIPSNIGLPLAGCFPLIIASLFPSVNSCKSAYVPGKKLVLPPSTIRILLIILLAITSICLSEISTP